jgi:flagellar hook-length control protein FliK
LPQPASVQEPQLPQTVSGAQLPEALGEAGDPSRQAEEEAAPTVRPSRQPSETGSPSLSALKPGEAAPAQGSGPALPSTSAAIFFAQLPGIAGAPVPSTAEPLRPLSPISADFSTGAPLRHLEIVLAPPELGTVRVVITREDGEMRVEMIASTSQAADMLESARESMVEAIRETGMRAGTIEIRQDLHAARPSAAGDLANGSAWHGKQEQGRHQGTENWQAGRAQSYAQSFAQAGRSQEGGVQNRGLIL